MKSIFTYTFLFLFAIKAFSFEREYNINLKIKGMENQIGILAYYYGDKRYVKDTLLFNEKGISIYKGNKEIPRGVYLLAFPSLNYRSFDLILNETNFSIQTDTVNFIKNATIKNSIENQQMFNDMNFMLPLGVKNDSLQKKLKQLNPTDSAFFTTENAINAISTQIVTHRKDLLKNNPKTFYSKLISVMMDTDIPDGERKKDGSLVDTFHVFHYIQEHYFDNIDFNDSGYIRSPVFQNKFLNYFNNYVHPSPDSIIKAIDNVIQKSEKNSELFQYCLNELFLKYAKSEIMGYDGIYVHIAEKYYLNKKAWWTTDKNLAELKDRVEALKPTLLGKLAPNFVVQDSTGKNQYFHDFITKNKYTVLVFWNSDCSHCQHEVPELKRIYTDSLQALGVGIMAISTEQTDSSFRAFAAKNCNTEWLTCADMRGVSAFRREYDVIATPKVFIIANNRKIIAKNITVNKIADIILFEEKLTKQEQH
jgi:alkyl hydroperoxide reductase subunit AhpC